MSVTQKEIDLDRERRARLDRATAEWIEAANAVCGADYHIMGLRDIIQDDRPASQPSNRRRVISGTTRANVLIRDGNKCLHCGSTQHLCMDHIHPVSKGGTNDEENLQTLCRSCNSKKGAKV